MWPFNKKKAEGLPVNVIVGPVVPEASAQRAKARLARLLVSIAKHEAKERIDPVALENLKDKAEMLRLQVKRNDL